MSTTSIRNFASSEGLDERKFVVALARGLELLRAFRPGEVLLGNRDFVERTGLPKATVNRLAYTLTTLGYLRFDEAAGKYALDTGVLSLGFALLAGADTLELARPHMRELAREIGAAVSLGCRDGFDMIYLETIRSETALTLGLADRRHIGHMKDQCAVAPGRRLDRRAFDQQRAPASRIGNFDALRKQYPTSRREIEGLRVRMDGYSPDLRRLVAALGCELV